MEIYILDSLLREIDVVDEKISIVWTEKAQDIGDFELDLVNTSANRKRFVTDTLLTVNKSKRVMKVETVEKGMDSEGRFTMKVKGQEITEILAARAALGTQNGFGNTPTWFIPNRTPGDIMRFMFYSICVQGDVSPADILPLVVWNQTLYPADTIPEPDEEINWEQKPSSLLKAEKELADIYDLNFRLYRDPAVARLYFNVYSGSDRTTDQSVLSPVIFAPDLENVLNTTEYMTVQATYNVAKVIWVETIAEYTDDNDVVHPEEIIVHTETVYADDTAPADDGFDRRVLLVEVTSVPEEVTDTIAFLRRAGKDELMKVRPLGALDGELSQYSQYVYERDYYLGDLVEQRDSDGATSKMRVAEQTFIEDAQGERSYPTLTQKEFINPGSWVSWKYNKDWADMGADEFWSTQE